MNIEFAGPPGSGKSSIASALCERLDIDKRQIFLDSQTALLSCAKQNIDAIYRPFLRLTPTSLSKKLLDKIWHRSVLHRHKLIEFQANNAELLSAVFNNPEFINSDSASRYRMLDFFYDTAAIFQCCHSASNDFNIIYDEGLIQKSSMFIATEANQPPEALYEYLSHLPTPALTILVEADPETCIERMETRPRGVTQKLRALSNSERIEYYRNATMHFSIVGRWLRENTQSKVLTVDSTQSLDENVETLFLQCESLRG